MAEGIAKYLLTKNNIHDIIINSCGTLQAGNTPPSENAVKVCAENGIDISSYLSKQINEKLVNDADLILTMESGHKRFIQKVFANSLNKTYLLTEYISDVASFDIPDPIGASLEVYSRVFMLIRRNVERIINNLTGIR